VSKISKNTTNFEERRIVISEEDEEDRHGVEECIRMKMMSKYLGRGLIFK
jgi:hypothetical protein